MEAVVDITTDFSDALVEAGIETPRDAIRRKLNELVVGQNVTPVNVEQGVIQAQGSVEQPVVQGSAGSQQTTPVEPGVVQNGQVQEDQPVPVEQPVAQPVEHQVTPSKEVALEPVEQPVTQDRKTILTFIRDQITAGIYLQPYQVAAKFGMDPQKMSKLIVIKPTAKKIRGKSVKVYKESHLPEIEELLKEEVALGGDVTPTPEEPKVTPSEDPLHPKPRSWFVPIYHERTLQSDKDAFLYKERKLPLIKVIKTEIGYRYTVNFNYMTEAQREAPRTFSKKEGLEHKIADFLYENQFLPADEQRKRVKKYMEEIK